MLNYSGLLKTGYFSGLIVEALTPGIKFIKKTCFEKRPVNEALTPFIHFQGSDPVNPEAGFKKLIVEFRIKLFRAVRAYSVAECCI